MNVRWKIRLPLRGPVACALLLALLSPITFAQTGPLTTQSLLFDQAAASHLGNYLGLQAGFIYTDNVFLERNGPGDELALLGLVGDAQRDGPRLDYKLDSDISLVKYLHEDFPTQPFGYLDGLAEFKIVPGLFSWTARDSYNDLIISPYLPITPDNLEAINYLTTGPRLMWQPTLRTSLVVNGVYSIIDSSSKSPLYVNIDNHRYGGDATISRAFSNTTSAYISATAEKVQFSDTLVNTDFREEGGAVGLKYSDLRTVADVSIGYEKLHTVNLVSVDSIIGVIERAQNATPSGTNWKVELSRLITPNQRVSLHARREITDAANLFRLGVDQPVPSTVGNQIVSGTPFTYTSYGASWRLQEARTSFQLSAYETTQRYQNTPSLNETTKIASALVERQIDPVLSWQLGTVFERDQYTISVNTINAITSVRWQTSRRVRLRLLYAFSETSPHGYKDNQVGVTVSYALTQPPSDQPVGEMPQMLPIAPMSPMQSPMQTPRVP
jgi:hypothetical protein